MADPLATRRSGWPGSGQRAPGWLLTFCSWLAPPIAAVLVLVALLQDVVPLRLVLPLGAVALIFAIRPKASTAIGLVLVTIPATALLRRLTGGPGAFVPDDPLAVLALAAALPAFGVALASAGRGRRPSGVNWYAAYLSWILFTSLLSTTGSPATQLSGLALAIVPAGIGYLVATGRIPGAERLTARSLLVLPILAAAYAIVQFFQPPAWDLAWLRSVSQDLTSVGVPEPQGFRVWGPMEAPLTLAIYLGLGLLAMLVIVIARRGEPDQVTRVISCALASALLLAALLLTSVRSVLFALPVLFTVIVLLNLIPGARRYGLLMLVIVIAGTSVGIGTLGLAPEGTESDRYAVSDLSQDQSFQDRADLLPDFLASATDPLGNGAGTSGIAQRLSEDGQPIGVDNGYLTLVLDGGVIRLVLFLILVGIGLVKATSVARRDPRDPAALLGVLTLLFFVVLNISADVVSGPLSIIFWIFLGAALYNADLRPADVADRVVPDPSTDPEHTMALPVVATPRQQQRSDTRR